MNKTNLDLLPQSPASIIRDTHARKAILELMSYLILEVIDTIKDFFIKKNLRSFDPHVGETACQLRAYNILILYTCKDVVLLEEEINCKLFELGQILNKITELINNTNASKNFKNNSISIEQLFIQENIIINLSSSLIFLVHAKILTHFKRAVDRKETYIDHNRLAIALI